MSTCPTRARAAARPTLRAFRGAALATLAIMTAAAWVNPTDVRAQDRYKPRGFDDYTNSSLNISVFVFRDLNRNRMFDVGDRPMNGVIVDATGNGRTLTRRSNMSGFTNFEMSASDAGKDITFSGDYEFRLAVPPGWHVTTDNAVQHAFFRLLPGSPADIVAEPPPLPVGLAPELTISGRVDPAVTQIEVRSPDDEASTIPTEAGRYTLPAWAGVWRIASGRLVEVVNAPVVLSMAGAGGMAADAPSGRDITVGFDDLEKGGVAKIPSGYGELNWNNFVMAHMKFYGSQGYRNNIISGEFVAYNGSGHPASISSAKPFDFIGGYLGASNFQAEGETLHIKAWRGDKLAYEENLSLSALGPIYFVADFQDIDRIDFSTEHYWQVTFEDLAFRLR
jgi:hypothetical protein